MWSRGGCTHGSYLAFVRCPSPMRTCVFFPAAVHKIRRTAVVLCLPTCFFWPTPSSCLRPAAQGSCVQMGTRAVQRDDGSRALLPCILRHANLVHQEARETKVILPLLKAIMVYNATLVTDRTATSVPASVAGAAGAHALAGLLEALQPCSSAARLRCSFKRTPAKCMLARACLS